MTKGLAYRMSVALINTGKMLPFLICVVVFVSYAESAFALATSDFLDTDDAIILNKPLSWLIADYFRYNIVTIVVLTILSYSINPCKWNKLALLYLAIQLYEKEYFLTIKLDAFVIYIICVVNMLVCSFLIYKGTTIFLKSAK